MFWISLKRIIRSGYINFKRNGVVSFASVLMMTITLSVCASLIFLQAILDYSLTQMQNNVDVTIYFDTTAPESRILSLKSTLEAMPEISMVAYTNRADALDDFKTRHANDFLTLQSLEELDDNPLGATLTVKAKDTTKYESITALLDGDSAIAKQYSASIDHIDYHQNKMVIEKLNSLIHGTQTLGYTITIALALVSMLITFITVRLTIYIAREEIHVMRLVGATNKYINGPFIVEGILCGLIAALVTICIYWPVTYRVHDTLIGFLGIDLYAYFKSNVFQLFGLLVLIGSVMGTLASLFAVRKHLKK